MKIVAVSDMHGRLGPVTTIVERERPDVLLSPGDWGDASEVDAADFQPFLERQPVLTTFGNHDNLELLPTLDNRDGSPILLENGTAREIAGLRIAPKAVLHHRRRGSGHRPQARRPTNRYTHYPRMPDRDGGLDTDQHPRRQTVFYGGVRPDPAGSPPLRSSPQGQFAPHPGRQTGGERRIYA
jgi:hypothetical protein